MREIKMAIEEEPVPLPPGGGATGGDGGGTRYVPVNESEELHAA